jgi:O-methyltransferase
MIKTALRNALRKLGFDIVRFRNDGSAHPPDSQGDETTIIREVRPFTMTSVERIYSLIQAVRYVTANGIEGAIVECGVWKGGSMAAVAKALVQSTDLQRDLFLFDTFEGMSEPTRNDIDYEGQYALDVMREKPSYRCADAPLESVKKVLYETGYPRDKLNFIQGKVEETIPRYAPALIALLRLDTDWYESTKHELTHLFPRLANGGVIIIDDYGHWKGSRQACDEYFAKNHIPILLNRIDYTGRIAVKLPSSSVRHDGPDFFEKAPIR